MQKTAGQIMADAIKAGERLDTEAMKAATQRQMPMARNITITSHPETTKD